MKYIEIGATYKVQIPKDFNWTDGSNDREAHRKGELTLDDYRLFWFEKEIKIKAVLQASNAEIAGEVYGRAGISYIEKEWLGELVRHCPQVEHYIKSQEKETYVSLITGKKI